ncbi:Ran-interacting Mog1 protein [Besnoitia besnoiti]|uniref:Ran-interacting Mog1 protein n=1 Tax=Besnoitia besnoiti TaxID=94643 RepID=A0A2A9MDM6_BESBE|nr:Ran-interacting Mog1 protein [Besnoitia besnoiti]PFH33783.1 Ran-interacting Mog1 protein [Besnoitia besnoiti]
MIRVPLFGGAMTCHLPETFKDVSSIRQVPDNQEVFMDMSSERSLVIEVVEYQETVSDADAARFFFCDLAKENGSTDAQLVSSSMWKASARIPVSEKHAVILTKGVQQLQRDNAKQVPVQMVIIRIPDHNAEILISLYGEPCDDTQCVSKAEAEDALLFEELISSFVIAQYSLFV